MAQCDNWADNEDNFVEESLAKYYDLNTPSYSYGMVAESEVMYHKKEKS